MFGVSCRPACGFQLGAEPYQRVSKIVKQSRPSRGWGLLPRYQDIVHAGQAHFGKQRACGLPEPAPGAVARDRAADPFRRGQPETNWSGGFAPSSLHEDRGPRRAKTCANEEELRALGQSLQGCADHQAGLLARRQLLGRELLAALGAATGQNLLAPLGRHAGAETMPALPNEPARLVGPLGAHDVASMLRGPGTGRKMKGRGLPHPPASVKAIRRGGRPWRP